MRPDGSPTNVLEDRLEQAVALHRAGKVTKLLLTGDHRQVGYDEANGMRRWVVERGVPPQDVFCDHAGLSTWDSFVRAREVFGVTRAIVVTQHFHLARALYTARGNGIEAQGVPCDARDYEEARWYAVREIGARCKAWLQSIGIASSARIGGPPISIEGDGRVTWDGADGARAVR